MKFFRRRDPDYVAPDAFLIIYGLPGPVGGFVALRYPGHLTWKVVLPEIKKVAKIYGRSVGGKASANPAQIDGTEPSVWASDGWTGYDWDGKGFVLVKSRVS